MSDTATQFVPPTPEQMAAHIQRHAPRPPSALQLWAPLLIVAGLFVMAAITRSGLMIILTWVALIGLFVFVSWRGKRIATTEQRVARVQELAMLRRSVEALRLAWRLVPETATVASRQARLISLMAHELLMLGQHDAAIIAFNAVLDRLPESHPAGGQLRLQRVLAQLHADQLADADDELRRLRASAAVQQPGGARAMYRLAQLLQQIRTYHYREAVAESDHLIEDLRPLGVDASHGYALLALALQQLAERAEKETADNAEASLDETSPPQQSADQLREQAVAWWKRATLLCPPNELIDHYPELEPLKALPAASASPPGGAS